MGLKDIFISVQSRLLGPSREGLDKRVENKWATQPWVRLLVNSERFTQKDAPRRFVRQVELAAKSVDAPIYVTLSESLFKQPTLGAFGHCWIQVYWPKESDGHLIIQPITQYLRGMCNLTQLSVSQDEGKTFDSLRKHHRDFTVWRLNFEKQ